MQNSFSPVIFLGICDAYSEPVIGTAKNDSGELFQLTRKDIIGLRNIFISNIFPLPEKSCKLVLLFDINFFLKKRKNPKKEIKIITEDDAGKSLGWSTISIEGGGAGLQQNGATRYELTYTDYWGVTMCPGRVNFFWVNEKKKVLIGSVLFHYSRAMPLTPERIKAIQSDPLSFKHVRFDIKCKECGDGIKPYASLDKTKNPKGYIWYESLPDKFTCKCKKTNFDLTYIKENLHSLLGGKPLNFSASALNERSYSRSALETTIRKFNELIKKQKIKEEVIQKFIEENPIVLHFLLPKLIEPKAPVGNKFTTDFVILNQRDELILVEIETPNTKLFTKKGDQHSELTHAIGQAEDWLREARRNRLGFIDGLKMDDVNIDQVKSIKAVVIAGRSNDDTNKHVEKLLSRNGDVMFYTFTDALNSIVSTVNAIEKEWSGAEPLESPLLLYLFEPFLNLIANFPTLHPQPHLQTPYHLPLLLLRSSFTQKT